MNDTNLLAEAAAMYYIHGLGQREIASKLGVTRQTVSKMISSARAMGLVEIKIHWPDEERKALSEVLCRRFDLKSASIAIVGNEDPELLRNALGLELEAFLRPVIADGGKHIGIAWGRTIWSFVQVLSPIVSVGNVVYPLLGSVDRTVPFYMANEIARVFAEKIQGEPRFSHLPFSPTAESDVALFKKSSSYQSMQSLWSTTDYALVSIGANNRQEQQSRTMYPSESAIWEHPEIFGDVVTHRFDRNGNFIPAHKDSICASVDDLFSAKHVVAVAGGIQKAEAIAAVLKAHLITDLITDYGTCREILAIV